MGLVIGTNVCLTRQQPLTGHHTAQGIHCTPGPLCNRPCLLQISTWAERWSNLIVIVLVVLGQREVARGSSNRWL